MREHPIPQDVTGYRFHIVGSMTIKQFAEIFLGVIIAAFIYNTNLIAPVKWFLIIFSVGFGAAAAFIPIEERPLDHWIITFFKVLYRPTQFYWRREVKIPEAFLYKPQQNQQILEPELDLTPARRQRIREYLVSVNTPSQIQSDLTMNEAQRVQNILSVFETEPVKLAKTTPEPKQVIDKPQLSVRVRSLRTTSADQTNLVSETQIFDSGSNNQSLLLETPTDDHTLTQPIAQTPPTTQAKPTAHAQPPTPATPAKSRLSSPTPPTTAGVDVPQTPVVQVTPATTNTSQSQPNDQAANTTTTTSSATPDPSAFAPLEPPPKTTAPTTAAAFNSSLPFPETPKEPNKIVGMVLTPNNELITNAIIQVMTEDGQIVRAVKTNALGQFFISTPLGNGDYTVVAEKPGYQFNAQRLVLSGEQLSPLEIRSL